jgi:hypothetical protein
LPVSDIIKRAKRDRVPGLIQFPENLGAHSMLLLFKQYKYNPPGSFGLNRIQENTFSQRLVGSQSVLLPLPANISDTYNVNVRGFEQGIGGEAVSTAASAVGSAGDISAINLVKSISKAIPGFDMASLTDIDNLARGAAYLGRRSIDALAPQAGRSLDAGLGSTINPKASLYFEGVTQKVHSFNWTLAPANRTESDSIRNITDLIKRNSLPSYGTLGFNKLLLNYPSMLDIFFLGVDQSYFLYYKTCMVTSFETNFTPNGLAFVKGGKPAMINMNMNVIEADIHTAEDYGGTSTNITADTTDLNSARNSALQAGNAPDI